MLNSRRCSAVTLSALLAAFVVPAVACGGEPGDEPKESSTTSPVETPADDPPDEDAPEPEPDNNPPAVQTGEPLKEEPPPVLEVRDEATTAARLAQLTANRLVADAPHAWFARFKQAAKAQPTLALVEVVSSDDGPDPTNKGRLSTWKVHDVLAGPALPSSITLFQPSPGGELGDCAMVKGIQGRVDAVLVEYDGSYFRLLLDDEGRRAFLHRASSTHYRWHGGPRVAASDLVIEAGAW
jgi:hypothetical protein